MLRRVVLLVALLVPLAGCVQAGEDLIEDARADARERRGEEESTDEGSPDGAPFGPPTPTPTPPTKTSTPATPTPTPPPAPTRPAPRAWPEDGSFVRLDANMTSGGDRTRVWANWTYVDGDWRGVCEGVTIERDGDVERIQERYRASDPPHWPLMDPRSPPAVGSSVQTWWLEGCDIRSAPREYEGVSGGRHEATSRGFHTAWDATTGLVVGWSSASSSGRLVATDAPLADRAAYVPPSA